MAATASRPLTLDLHDATASLDAIWDSVVEKMNSTPGTPRDEATKTLAEAQPDKKQDMEKDVPVPVKPTIDSQLKSPLDEEGRIAALPSSQPRLNTQDQQQQEEKEEEQKFEASSSIQTTESRVATSHGEAKDVAVPEAQISPPSSENLKQDVREAEEQPTQTSETPLNDTKEEEKDVETPTPAPTTTEETSRDMGDSKSSRPEQEDRTAEAITDENSSSSQAVLEKEIKDEHAGGNSTTITPQLNGVKEGKKEGQTALDASSQTAIKPRSDLKVDVKKHLEVPANPEAIPLPNSPVEGRASAETKDFEQPEKTDKTQAPAGTKDEKDGEDKKSLQIFTKLKRKLSTNNVRERKQQQQEPEAVPPQPPLPKSTPAPAPNPITPVEGPQHIELVKTKTKSPPTSAKEGKEGKKSSVIFKSIRAAMKFSSGKSSVKSPTTDKAAPLSLTQPPLSPERTRKLSERPVEVPPPSPGLKKSVSKAAEQPFEKPALRGPTKSTPKPAPKQLERKYTEKSLPRAQPSVRRPGHNAAAIKPPLRPRQTWSPATSNPILASNPNAKLYTIWPRYPVVAAQTDEVQAVLEGFLLNEKAAIEKSCASGDVINFWKAPLTTDQAAVVQGNKFVSSIQLSKLDYDPSDYFC